MLQAKKNAIHQNFCGRWPHLFLCLSFYIYLCLSINLSELAFKKSTLLCVTIVFIVFVIKSEYIRNLCFFSLNINESPLYISKELRSKRVCFLLQHSGFGGRSKFGCEFKNQKFIKKNWRTTFLVGRQKLTVARRTL